MFGDSTASGAWERSIPPRLVIQRTNGAVVVSFPAEQGQPYRIQRSTGLPNWTDLLTNTPQSNTTISCQDSPSGAVFYRVTQGMTP